MIRMGLALVMGRSGRGKTYFCLEQIKKKATQNRNKKLILVVPEQYSFQAEKELLNAVGKNGILNQEVLSFRRLSYRVFNEVGGLTKKHIDEIGKSMLIQNVLEKVSDKLEILSSAAKKRTFGDEASKIVSEFKKYMVSVHDIQKAVGSMPENSVSRKKIEDIIIIYDSYIKEVQDKYLDIEDELVLLASKLPLSKQFDDAEFWFDGFSGFTPSQYAVIIELLKKASKVSITLTTPEFDINSANFNIDEQAADVFLPAKKTALRLVKLAGENNINIDEIICVEKIYLQNEGRFSNSPALSHLERYFFTNPYKKFEQCSDDIAIFTASNTYSEVEEAASRIVELVRDKGLRYREIAVVCRNLDSYKDLIASIFKEYNIPFFIDRKLEVTSHPVVRLVISVLEIFHQSWSYDSVFSYLKTGLTGISLRKIDLLENYVLRWGIKASHWTQEEPWLFKDNNDEMEDDSKVGKYLEKINAIRYEVSKPLLELRKNIGSKVTVKEMCEAIFNFLTTIKLDKRIRFLTRRFQLASKFVLAEQYRQVWNIVIKVLDQAVEIMGEEKCGIERFRYILEAGFSQCSIGLIPPSQDQVLAANMERSRSHEVKALFVLGANDGVIPFAANKEGILSDKEREMLEKSGVELENTSKSKLFEEQYIIYSAFTTPSKLLFLSYPVSDVEGKSMRPSLYIERFRKMFPNIAYYEDISKMSKISTIEDFMHELNSPSPAFRHMTVETARTRAQIDQEMVDFWKCVLCWYGKSEDYNNYHDIFLQALSYKNQPENVDPHVVKQIIGDPVRGSISRFEKYRKCPFSFYISYVLRAKEREVFGLRAPDLGQFMHEAMEIFSKKVEDSVQKWAELDQDKCDAFMENAVEEVLNKSKNNIFMSNDRYRYFSKKLKTILSKSAWVAVQHILKGEFVPLAYEMDFGNDGKLPPVEIKMLAQEHGQEDTQNEDEAKQKIEVFGRIDRVDVLKKNDSIYIRILDYKSGEVEFSLSELYEGLQLQLIVYLDAVLTNFKEIVKLNSNLKQVWQQKQDVVPAGIFYFQFKDPVVKASISDNEDNIKKMAFKKYKLKGLLLAEPDIIKAMDKNLSGYSDILPVQLKKNDSKQSETGTQAGNVPCSYIGKRSMVATKEQFNQLISYTRNVIKDIAQDMLSGKADISPYKISGKNESSCSYCPFPEICQFDAKLNNKYRSVKKLSDEEVWEAIKNAGKTMDK